ncbi:MAG: hypothetical protein ABIQ35_08600 [Verrucomicrobiota bacterium]
MLSWFGCIVLVASVSALKVSAADPKLEVQLVWGTNDETSPDAKHKPLEEALAKKLGMFKWKKYFVVNRQEIPVSATAQKIKLSEKCEIEIKNIEPSRYEINVFGKGKHVLKKTGKITNDPPFVIAGDDKNDCAWFILIREH